MAYDRTATNTSSNCEIAAEAVHAPKQSWHPLSAGQLSPWFEYLLHPGNQGTYNVGLCVRAHGSLSSVHLRTALQVLIARQPMLAAEFAEIDEQPMQRIRVGASPEVARIQARDWSAEQLTEAVQADFRRPFDLQAPPLIRASVFDTGEDQFVLLLACDHIVCDGWSVWLLLEELGELVVRSASGDLEDKCGDTPIKYFDYVRAQQQALAGAVGEKQWDFWRRQLDKLPVLDLPLDRPRATTVGHRCATLLFTLESTLSSNLKTLTAATAGTLYSTLLAAFQILLQRYSGQDEVVLGTVMPARGHGLWDRVVGQFINPVVLRIDLSGNPTVRLVLRAARDTSMRALMNQDFPLSVLVQKLGIARDSARHPMFQVMFLFQNARHGRHLAVLCAEDDLGAPVRWGGLDLKSFPLHQNEGVFDLTLEVIDLGDRIQCGFKFNSDLFDQATIERMQRHFRTLLTAMVANPDARIDELQLMTPTERRQVLVGFNQTAVDSAKALCLHELFEQHAAMNPAATALIADSRCLTYAELNARANQVGHRLRSMGVGPDVLVAIFIDRSIEMVVGLLGILKAGGAYVPIDPNYPLDRIAFVMQDAAPRVVLTQKHLEASLPPTTATCLFIDDADGDISREPMRDLPARETGCGPSHLAYVIYTSGSTGRPKGVMVEHRQVVNYVASARSAYGLGAGERVLQFASVSFDAAVEEIFGTLANGATLVLRDEEILQGLNAVRVACERHAISVLALPTAFWNRLMADLESGADFWPDCVRLTVIGGEAAPLKSHAVWNQCLNGECALINTYGPTETTVVVSRWQVKPAADSQATAMPIGRPIANTQMYILDPRGQPVPIGVIGEIYVGGAQVARGYLHQPELTAQRFITNPFASEPGERMYKTGDLARWRADGAIEYMGRNDFQVKIRGFRIELGEIEARLAAHPAVREAVVVAREDTAGDKRLVAYLVARGEESVSPPTTSELRSHLQATLPEYMVPAAFVTLDELPLTPNGKLDRKALPAPDHSGLQGAPYIAPRTPVEQVLAEIWSAVLHVERVGVQDNFFELGGHSLLATQVLGRLRPAFGVEVPLRALFETPTIEALAQHLDVALRGDASSCALPLVTVSRDGDLALSFAQQRLWFLDQLAPGSASYNMPVAVRLKGVLDVSALEQSFCEIVRRHEALRTRFVTTQGQARQQIDAQFAWSLPVIDVQEADVQGLAQAEAGKPFDLACGPLLRTTLLRLSAQEHVVLVTMHHIVSDGWSMGVLVRELGALYEAFAAGRSSPLQELPIQYADYAEWQRQWLSGEVLESKLAYWKKQLGGAPAALELPTDRPRPAVQTHRGAVQPLQLSHELSQGLTALSRREGVTLFMTLLAAFQMLMRRYSGQDDIVVGSPIAGRTQVETEALIGFFVNTLALRTELSGEITTRELLGRVREVTLGAYAHQEVPFEKLVEVLAHGRDMSRSPLFQVMLVLQNAPMGQMPLGDVTLEPVEVAHTTAKFEMTLALRETQDGLQGGLEYNADLFDAATVERMASNFTTLLTAMLEQPEACIDELPLMTPAEREQVLVGFNDTAANFPQELCVHELFEQQAARTPAATAVVFEDQSLTYAELNTRANQLAHHLRSLGVGPDVLVAICVERSIEMVVGLLAILKAGGAYLPLDPTYPKARLAFMLQDAAPKVVLTQKCVNQILPATAAPRLWIDELSEALSGWPGGNIGPASIELRPQHLAYVIYTSGSTGKPKGVMIEHCGVVNLAIAQAQAWGVTDSSRVLQFASFSFDACVSEVVIALSQGAALHLPPPGTVLADAALTTLLRRSAITHVTLPPVVLATLPDDAIPTNVECLILAGEASSAALVQRWCSGRRLFNAYGPTETTVCASMHECPPDVITTRSVPIGRPMHNMRCLVLDAHMQAVPIGVPGELYIGGVGVARGYLNRPELTAERFIADPFSGKPGARLYKTGDLCRWLPDGNLDYLGRIDHQVKIRGFRIELGEIEARLAAHPAVREAVVVAREDTAGDKRLVAYLVARGEESVSPPTTSELRSHLQATLPEYMVPAAFVTLDELPLTPNGKLDRKALPAPDHSGLQGAPYIAPRTPVEQVLAEIWSAVLHVERVGVQDNFFELGGHSLLAVQITARVRAEFGIELPLSAFFQHPTLQGVAKQLAARHSAPQKCLVSIAPHSDGPPLFLIHPSGGNVMCYADLARKLGGSRPIYGLQSVGLDGKESPLRSVEAMAERYLRELREAQPVGPYFLAAWSFGGLVAYEMAHRLRCLGEQVAMLALFDTRASYPADFAAKDDLDLITAAFEGLVEFDLSDLRKMPRAEALSIVMAEGQRIGLIPSHVDLDVAERLLTVEKLNIAAARAYRPPRYNGQMILFVATESLVADIDDERLGWSDLLQHDPLVHRLAMRHHAMMFQPHVETVGTLLREYLSHDDLVDATQPGLSMSSHLQAA